jgi:hypothetical protein
MPGDINRDTFDEKRHFSKLIKQQGRVDLASDDNEAMDILLHYQRTVASDLIGPHGTPPAANGSADGFHIQTNGAEDFHIGRGRYYVDGILCENEGSTNLDGNLSDVTYLTQPDYPQAPPLPAPPFMVYLKVWERHITALEDDYIREKALGGPDTASRNKVVWQVKAANELPNGQRIPNDATCEFVKQNWAAWVEAWHAEQCGLLKAMTADPNDADLDNPCITSPKAGYRGAENQLYRVEIHTSGTAGTATFKWSRDNASMAFPVARLAGGDITLGYLGRDSRHSLEPGQWVELVDDTLALREEVRPLGKVKAVDQEQRIVTVDWPQNADLPVYDSEEEYKSKHVLLRRWDHTDRSSVPGSPNFDAATGTLLIEESADANSDNWLLLENGIRISFTRAASGEHQYYTGDYWLIPARTATGDVEWPLERTPSGELVMRNNRPVPEKRPPHGIERHYAPLAVILTADGQASDQNSDCRRTIVSVIGSETDLRVHNLDVAGSLNVTGNTSLGGQVGIGTTTPRNPLAIRAQGPSDELISFEDPNGITKWHINQNLGGNNPGLNIAETEVADGRLFIKPGGNIGIGTASPQTALDVKGALSLSTNNTADNKIKLTREILLDTVFFPDSPNNLKLCLADDIGNPAPTYGLYIGHPSIRDDNGIARPIFVHQMRILSDGSVNVRGTITAGGAIMSGAGKGGYVMDQFINNLGDTLEQGDVVVIGENQASLYYGQNDNIPIPEIDLAQREYDTRVCGIVHEVHIPLAQENSELHTTGTDVKKSRIGKGRRKADLVRQVFTPEELEKLDRTNVEPGQIGWMVTLGAFAHCKVDADIASIQVGDLLTTSPTKGHAQKVLDPSKAIGAILGKALGSLKKGKGKIPVLVMLQ